MVITRFCSLASTVVLTILCCNLVSVHARETPTPFPSESSSPVHSLTPSPSESSSPEHSLTPSPSESLSPVHSESPVPTYRELPVYGNCTEPSACDDGSCGTCKTSRGEQDRGCSCSRCECKVCEIDPYCCVKQWDHICVQEADDLCTCQILPTESPSSSPSVSMAPSYIPHPSNMYFTLSNRDWQSRNITGIYAANTEGKGGPASLIFEGAGTTPIGITATSCGTDHKLYWIDQDYNSVMYGSLDDPKDRANTLYSYLRARDNSSTYTIYGMLGIAVNEAEGKLFIGANGGLYMAELDGSSTYASVLENSSKTIPALTVDPATGFLYYGGREYDQQEYRYQFFVRELRPPYDQPARALYKPEYFQYRAQPRDIAVDTVNDILYFTDNTNVYQAALDGTSREPELLYSGSRFNVNYQDSYREADDKVRTLEYHMGGLFMGVFGFQYTRVYEGNPSDPASNLTVLYDLEIPPGYNSGIRGIVVSDCPPPTESPTPCGLDKELTTPVSPVPSTILGVGQVAFVIATEWAAGDIGSVGIDIDKLGTSNEWEAYTSLSVDPASSSARVYVTYENFMETGTYQWRATIGVTGDPCQTEETTDNTTFTLS